MPQYRRGDRGPAVADIRAKLRVLGLLPDEVDDLANVEFDAPTERAVRTFQQSRGLACDGVVGAESYRALDEARWHLGDRVLFYQVNHPLVGDDVASLQAWLDDRGFDVGRCDGIFGPRTEAALREFQRNVGLAPDGTLGPSTHRAIRQLARSVGGGRPSALREHVAFDRAGRTLAGKIVVVDPGHGGDDPGWRSHPGADSPGELTEAEVAFDIATRLEGRLAAMGALPFLTRSADSNVRVDERANFANSAEADLYVAIHCDGSTSPRCEGVATYFFAGSRGGSALGERLAELVQHEIVARTDLLDCRSHGKSWELLRLTRMPAVEVDVGYLTSPRDAARLADAGFRDAVAEAILVALQRLYMPPETDPGTGQLRLGALQLT